jgi:peptidoglycan/LPS O-acetylase OafA/YrhL
MANRAEFISLAENRSIRVRFRRLQKRTWKPDCYSGAMKSKPNLDLLRSIAVLLVVVEHILLAMRLHWIGNWDMAWFGVVGVFMFFVHTSLVLMWSLERKPHMLDFYIRRIFRIYPLAIAAILITLLFHIPTMHNINGDTYFAAAGIKNTVSNLLQLQNVIWPGNILGVMWTLPLEVDMYFLLPFLFFFTRFNFTVWPLLALWAATVVYDRSAFLPDNNSFAVCIPYFLSGVIAYVLFAKVKPRLPVFLMPLLIAALLCVFMVHPAWRGGWWLTLILGLALPHFRPLRARWLVQASHHTAKYSYGIYLVHPFSIVIGLNLLHGSNLAIRLGAIFGSLALIVIPAYHLLEKPMINLGAKIAARVEQRAEKVATPA